MSIIIGINAYHGDASACLLRDGIIVAAAEEERFRRVKHWAGFPSESIRFCLDHVGTSLSAIEHIAVNSDPKSNIFRRIGYAVSKRPGLTLILERVRNQTKRLSIASEFERAFPGATFRGAIHRVEHHLAHLASGFLVSPFQEAVVASVDGFGDFASAAWGIGRGCSISLDGRVWFPHSLGAYYQAMTQYLGFLHYGDEYKVMGLAPYGEPRYLPQMRKIVRLNDDGTFALQLRYFRHHTEKVDYQWNGGAPHVGILFSPELQELLGPARKANEPIDQWHRDIARSTQAMYEEAFLHLLRTLHARYRIDSLALAGGCAMNSVANGKVKRLTPFKRIYVQAAAGDAGGAIGAAVSIWHKLTAETTTSRSLSNILASDPINRAVMDHAYLGPACGETTIDALIDANAKKLEARNCQIDKLQDQLALCRHIAGAIAKGCVVGWFQGRMEWGPRALGNRSILCDPRRADMKDLLNLKIKRRESFRPFAPSILREHVADWFEEDDDVPFMMQVFQIRAEKRPLIPAVTHVDGSGRLQTVHRQTNPLYWQLIETFREITGVPILLNTSFNENEPVVCKAEEALDCFLRTRMDILVLNSWVVSRVAIRGREKVFDLVSEQTLAKS